VHQAAIRVLWVYASGGVVARLKGRAGASRRAILVLGLTPLVGGFATLLLTALAGGVERQKDLQAAFTRLTPAICPGRTDIKPRHGRIGTRGGEGCRQDEVRRSTVKERPLFRNCVL
jgi:hypothetical protein